jgi:hypothetical protein
MGRRPQPRLSVVVLTDSFATIRDVVDHLLAQTVADQVELVIVAPSRDLANLPSTGLERLAGVQVVEHPLLPLGPARAAGVRASRGDVVVLGETHAFAAPQWAERQLAAHEGPWGAVAPGVGNANPGGAFSWAIFLQDYGRWPPGVPAGEIDEPPTHNTSYKRALLLPFGESLDELLRRGGDIHAMLRREGHRLYAEPSARIDHLNVTAVRPWIVERVYAGRLFAAARCEGWSARRRFAYGAASPLIAVVVYARAARTMRVHATLATMPRGVRTLLALGSLLWAAGEGLGYVGGYGRSEERMLEYEMHKARYAR